jgi:Tfp pilus assembly protein PilX
MNKRGVALILGFMVIVVLTILGAAVISRSVSERLVAQRCIEANQAFWLAEAGVARAQYELRKNPDLSDGNNLLSPVPVLGPGEYNFDLTKSTVLGVTNYTVTARGCIPNNCNCVSLPNNCRATRILQATMNQYQNIPTGFYDNAIYSAGNVTIGSNCVVNGDVFSGGTISGPVNGDRTPNDPTLQANGLPGLSFDQLRQKSIEQGWYNPNTNTTTYPTDSFWYVAPSPDNPIGVPNVVFVNSDFNLVGGNQVVKGFIVVGGNTIYNAEIGGNATVDGCIYTRGNIWLHGGGGKLINVRGGVWAGGTTTLEGNEQIDYNATYMTAIRDGLNPNIDIRITAWQDTQNPYKLNP